MSATPLPRLITSDNDRAQRVRAYDENRRYYDGDHKVTRSTRSGRAPAEAAPRNYSALFVDTVTAHMGRPVVTFGEDDEQADTFTEYLAETLAEEDGEVLDYDAEVSCAVDGDAAQKVTWDDEEQRVRVALVDPARLWVRHRPDNIREVEAIAEQYVIDASSGPVLFPGGAVRAVVTRTMVTEVWTRTSWEVWLAETLEMSVPNPYGFIPYVLYPNWRSPGKFWGRGDPARLRRLQDRINSAANDLDTFMEIASNVLVLEGVDDHGDLAIRPGAILDMPAESKAYVLDLLTGDMAGQRLAHLGELRDAIHGLGRIPVSALGNLGRDISGTALQIELGPLVRLVNQKRLYRTAALRRRAQLVVALGARFGGLPELPPGMRPSVNWDDAIPADRGDELSNAEAELRLGRSRASILRTLGVEDPAAELAARVAEDRMLAAAQPRPKEEPSSERERQPSVPGPGV